LLIENREFLHIADKNYLGESTAREPMKFARQSLVVIAASLLSFAVAAAQNTVSKNTQPEWRLSWSDEFNGPNGSPPDASKWTLETGGNGWGNNELEYYTDRIRNAYQEDGNLVIKVLAEKFTGMDGVTRSYTSARLKTQGKFTQAYGRFEARIKIPRGQGIWPAFWMLGADIDKVGWPACGEIDIMENIGKEPATVHGTIHGPGYSGSHGIGAPFSLPAAQHFADDFHVYAVEWEPKAIRFYVDDHLYETRTPADLPTGTKWVYDHPFFILLNVAVGGYWPGNPDASTVFPQTMLVDYVRVYQRIAPEHSKSVQR
jgi:beta-glucanase (GH16 family)